jgi:hypothetical protein
MAMLVVEPVAVSVTVSVAVSETRPVSVAVP